MAKALTTASLSEGIRRMAAAMEAGADELNRLDGALGDGDLGVTLLRGSQNLVAELPSLPPDVGLALMRCAQVFTRVSGSTFGTLLATGLMAAAKRTKGREFIPWTEVSGLIAEAIADMSRRGKGELGDKTVLDALEAARAATAGLEDGPAIARAADLAIAKSLDDFRERPAKQGRARILAERSIGSDDPGMVAIKRLLESLL